MDVFSSGALASSFLEVLHPTNILNENNTIRPNDKNLFNFFTPAPPYNKFSMFYFATYSLFFQYISIFFLEFLALVLHYSF